MATTEAERMTFLDKKRFFEKEIKDHVTGKKHVQERKFSYLKEHEVENLRTEEEVKVASMTEDELSRYMEEKLVTEGTDYNKIITSSSKVWMMKSEQDDGKKDDGDVSDVAGNKRKSLLISKHPVDERISEADKQLATRKIRMDSPVDDVIKTSDKLKETPHFIEHDQNQQNNGYSG